MSVEGDLRNVPEGTVWDESRPDGKKWFLVRTTSEDGHLFAWLPEKEVTADAIDAFRSWAGTPDMVTGEDVSVALRCANTDFAETARTRVKLQTLRAPEGCCLFLMG